MHYIIKDESNSTYYAGTNHEDTITEEHFTTNIYEAIILDSVEQATKYMKQAHMMYFIRLIELPYYNS